MVPNDGVVVGGAPKVVVAERVLLNADEAVGAPPKVDEVFWAPPKVDEVFWVPPNAEADEACVGVPKAVEAPPNKELDVEGATVEPNTDAEEVCTEDDEEDALPKPTNAEKRVIF